MMLSERARNRLRVISGIVAGFMLVAVTAWGIIRLNSQSAVLEQIDKAQSDITEAVGEVRAAQDLTLGNREQGLRNRRVNLCFARAVLADEATREAMADPAVLIDVCLLSPDEAAFVVGVVAELPDPEIDDIIPTEDGGG